MRPDELRIRDEGVRGLRVAAGKLFGGWLSGRHFRVTV